MCKLTQTKIIFYLIVFSAFFGILPALTASSTSTVLHLSLYADPTRYISYSQSSPLAFNRIAIAKNKSYAYITLESQLFNETITKPGSYHLPVAVLNNCWGITFCSPINVTLIIHSHLLGSNKVPFNGLVQVGSNVLAEFSDNTFSSINQTFNFSLSPSEYYNFTFEGLGNNNYSFDDPVVTPAHILSYLPVNIVNTQTVAYTTNSQVMIPINALNYGKYYSSNLRNAEWFYANGTLIPSWLEGNATNEMNTNSLNLATNVIYWLRIYPANTFLGASATNTVYLGWAGNVISASNTLMDGVNTGEAPQLSSTYGKYDNGINVFTNYWNFAGTSLPSGWDYNASNPSTVNNGITIPGSSSSNPFIYTSFNTPSGGVILDTLVDIPSTGTQLYNVPLFLTSTITSIGADLGYLNTLYSGGALYSVGAGQSFTQLGTYSVSPAGYHVIGLGWSGNTISAVFDYATELSISSNTYSYPSTGYISLQNRILDSNTAIFIQWIFSSTYPPDGIQSSTNYGSVRTISSFFPAINPILLGQSQSLTSTLYNTTLVSPYTYNFLVYNNTGILVANALYSTSATQNTFTYIQNSSWGTGSFSANLIIKDAGSNTLKQNTTYTAVLPPLKSLFTTNNQTIYQSGQSETLNANVSGGSSPYTFNILVYAPNGNLAYNSLSPYNSVTFNSITFVPSEVGKWTANVVITDNQQQYVVNSISFAVIKYYHKIIFYNYQTSALESNTPIAIGTTVAGGLLGFNATKYQQYYTCNLNNAEFFYPNGTIIPSWLEGDVQNEQSSNALCTSSLSANSLVDSSNVLYWVKIGTNAASFLPAGTATNPTSNTVYLGWAGNVISASNTLMDGVLTGEAPKLSVNYGQYDNGANVFNHYWNFAGTSLPNGLSSVNSGGFITVNNGLTVKSNTGGSYAYVYLTNGLSTTANVIREISMNTYGSLGNDIRDRVSPFYSTINSYPPVTGEGFNSDLGYMSGSNGFYYAWENAFTSTLVPTASNLSDYNIIDSIAFFNSGIFNWNSYSSSYLTYYSNSGSFTSGTLPYVGIGASVDSGYNSTSIINAQWLRTRISPPDGILPATIEPSNISSVSLFLSPNSPTVLDAGQTPLTLTSVVEGGQPPYTYQFIISNPITKMIEGSTVKITNSSSETVSILLKNASSSPLIANVIVTDVVGYTANSTYSNQITVNPSFGVSSCNLQLYNMSNPSTTFNTTAMNTLWAWMNGGSSGSISGSDAWTPTVLNNGNVIWATGDTTSDSQNFHNLIVEANSQTISNIHTIYGAYNLPSLSDFIEPASYNYSNGPIYWTSYGDGLQVGNSAYTFFGGVPQTQTSTSTTVVMYPVMANISINSITLANTIILPTTTPSGTVGNVLWNTALQTGNETYIYGAAANASTTTSINYSLTYVARVPTSQISNTLKWTFWNGSSWTSNVLQLVSIATTTTPAVENPALSVVMHNGVYVMVSGPSYEVDWPYGKNPYISALFSCSPQGPFVNPINIWDGYPVFGSYGSGYVGLNQGNVYGVDTQPQWDTFNSIALSFAELQTAGPNDYKPHFLNAVLESPHARITASSITPKYGQVETLTATAYGGTPPYTYDFQIRNATGTLLTNAIQTSSLSTNSMFYTINTSGTVNTKVFITDNASTPLTVNSSSLSLIIRPSKQYFIPINLINSQNTGTSAGFDQMITFNALSVCNAIICAPHLNNTYFYYANGSMIRAWYESASGEPNNYGSNTFSSSTNVIIWLDIAPTNYVPAFGYNTVYMGFAPNNVNNFGTKAGIGEAPELTFSYAKYDNGNTVFPFYYNFAGNLFAQNIPGNAVNMPWSVTCYTNSICNSSITSTVTVDNGLSLNAIQYNQLLFAPVPNIPSGMALDALVSSLSTNQFSIGLVSGETPLLKEITSGYLATISNSDIGLYSGISNNYNLLSQSSYPGGSKHVDTLLWHNTDQYAYLNYSVVTNSTSNTISISNLIAGKRQFAFRNALGGNTIITWARERAAPPNAVMPSVSFANLTVSSNTVPTTITTSSSGSTATPTPFTITLSDNLTYLHFSNNTVFTAYVKNSGKGIITKFNYSQSQLPAHLTLIPSEYLIFKLNCNFSSNSSNYMYAGITSGLGHIGCNTNHTVYGGIYTALYKKVYVSGVYPNTTNITKSTKSNYINIQVSKGQSSADLCGNSTTYYAVNYIDLNSTFFVKHHNSGCEILYASTTKSTVPFPPNISNVLSLNVSLKESNHTVLNTTLYATIHYFSNTANVVPYILNNNTWIEITPFYVNSTAHTISFNMPQDPIITIVEYKNLTSIKTEIIPVSSNQTLVSGNTTVVAANANVTTPSNIMIVANNTPVPNKTPAATPKQNNFVYAEIIATAIIIIIIVFMVFVTKKRK